MSTRSSPSAGARLFPALSVGLFALIASPTHARPTSPRDFCAAYPNSPSCQGTQVTCAQCHISTAPPSWNTFGLDIQRGLEGARVDEGLLEALMAIEAQDSDEDGISNLEEIMLGTAPGDPASFREVPVAPEEVNNPGYRIGEYDPNVALRRVKLLYCGRSPSYEERAVFTALGGKAQREELHRQLSACLDGDYWRRDELPRLADERIKPIYSVGLETDVTLYGSRLVLGDYEWDYRLWRYVMTDDRDVRDLLRAQYHVEEDDRGVLTPVQGAIADLPELGAGGQPLEPARRAGMLTTQWFLMANTMFSGLPRTTAAQAYRAYLGADISQSQGIQPVEGEPRDIDNKGVAAASCAACHSTLDPLAYAFAYYTGIELVIGVYDEQRPASFMPDWDPEEQRSVLFGEQVDDLPQWAAVAAESDAFKRNLALIFFRHALTRAPGPADYAQFEALWRALPEDGYSVNRLIHRLIDTEAFGAV